MTPEVDLPQGTPTEEDLDTMTDPDTTIDQGTMTEDLPEGTMTEDHLDTRNALDTMTDLVQDTTIDRVTMTGTTDDDRPQGTVVGTESTLVTEAPLEGERKTGPTEETGPARETATRYISSYCLAKCLSSDVNGSGGRVCLQNYATNAKKHLEPEQRLCVRNATEGLETLITFVISLKSIHDYALARVGNLADIPVL
jgi:hypothetical protein